MIVNQKGEKRPGPVKRVFISPLSKDPFSGEVKIDAGGENFNGSGHRSPEGTRGRVTGGGSCSCPAIYMTPQYLK
jgi:hypothetical protein